MELFDIISARRSIRSYERRAVENEKIDKIVAAATAAPSAGDLQAYEIIVVTQTVTRSLLAAAAHGQEFLAHAPAVLVFLADPQRSASRYGLRGERLFSIQDATIAASYAQLSATALGLGCCWVGAFDDARVGQAVGAPERLRAVSMLAVGYPAERPARTPRRPMAEMLHRETFKP